MAPVEAVVDELGEELVLFHLGDTSYGIPAHAVREVQPLGSYARLPFTSAWVVGLVNVRGRLLTLLDIRPLLDIAVVPPQPNACLLILTANGIDVALLTDRVSEVRHADRDLVPPLATTAGRGVAWVRGVDRHLTLILDPSLLMADPRLIISGDSSNEHERHPDVLS